MICISMTAALFYLQIIDHTITCLSGDSQADIVAVGTTHGNLWIFDKNLQELCQVELHQV